MNGQGRMPPPGGFKRSQPGSNYAGGHPPPPPPGRGWGGSGRGRFDDRGRFGGRGAFDGFRGGRVFDTRSRVDFRGRDYGHPDRGPFGGRGDGPGRGRGGGFDRGPPPPRMGPPPPQSMFGRGPFGRDGRVPGPPPPPPIRGRGPGSMMNRGPPPSMNLHAGAFQGNGPPPFPPPGAPPRPGFGQPPAGLMQQQIPNFPPHQQQRIQQQLPPVQPLAPPPVQPQHTQPTFTQQQVDEAWSEHTAPDGKTKYYYNSISKESTYTIPQAMAKKLATPEPSAPTWKEYTEASTGKKYYSNGVTTTWEKPPEMGGDVSETKRSVDKVEDIQPKKKKKTGPKKVTQFGSKAEAVAAFKGLLLAKGISPVQKWNEVVKSCESDTRWEACEILSLGERKQALAEYQTKRANELKNQEREERMRAKNAFQEMLGETLPSIEFFNPLSSRFSEIKDYLTKDDRFYAVEDEVVREELFLEFCEELRKRDERRKRSKRREAKESFQSFLREREESGKLSYASTWKSFLASLTDAELVDSRFRASAFMSDPDRELYFSDYVIDLQAAEDEKRRRIKDARRRAEKAQREAYRSLLDKLALAGTIAPSTRFRNVESILAQEPEFGPLEDQNSEAPRELFDDYIEEWSDVYRSDRKFLSRLAHPSNKKGISVRLETSFDDFKKALLEAASESPDDYQDTRHILNQGDFVSSALVYYNELLSRAKESAETSKRRRGSQAESSEDEGEIIEDGEVEG